jgi:transmembrane protein 132
MIKIQTSNLTISRGNLNRFLIKLIHSRIVEVFSWLLEVANDTKEHWDGGRIVWSVSYVHDGPKSKDVSAEAVPHEETRKKLVAKLEIQKDDIQSVLPIAKVKDIQVALF